MSFDIVTVTYKNHEWVPPFLLSLKKTLDNKNRKICIVDSSPLEQFNELRKTNTYGLDVSFIHLVKRDAACALLDGIKCLSFENLDDPVCVVHADVIFLLKGWDTYLESQLSNYKSISVASRYKVVAETTFIVSSKGLLLESKFMHGPADWDQNVAPIPECTEHGYFTYLHHLRKMNLLLFDQSYTFQKSRWGEIIYDDQGREFFYHNFYSSRCKKEDEIPDIEWRNAKQLIESCESNAKFLGQLLEFDLEYSMRDELMKMILLDEQKNNAHQR